MRAQTYPRIEHVVVDGGSTDGTVEILRREAEAAEGMLHWQSGPDQGMYDGINKGLTLARGDILAYLNSDDAWLPWTVETVMRAFESKPDVDLVFGDGVKVDESDRAQRLRLFPPFDRISLANYESLMQPAVFWRRRLTDRIGGFDSGLRYVADLDYWLRAAGAGAKIAHVNEVIAVERIHSGRLSSAQAEAMAAEDREMRARHAREKGGPAGRQLAVSRHMRWQRWLWFRFVVASQLGHMPGPWHRFLREGEVKVRPRKALSGLRPHKSKRLRNAVVSRVAADVLHDHSE